MHQAEKDRSIYSQARSFLLEKASEGITVEVLDSYLSLPAPTPQSFSRNDLYFRLLGSAQNANMKVGVIGGSIGGVENLRHVLFEFDPDKVVEKYTGNPEKLLDDIVEVLEPKGKVRRTPRSIWPNYCKTIISSAEFFIQFSNSKEFFDWAGHFYEDTRSRAALPLILEAEIFGIAFPLACDFLKELGYVEYGKPDVHIIEIFQATGLIQKGASNYQVLKAISRIAENVGVTPYNVDKLFWLIGSGFFYSHPQVGNCGRIGRLKGEFIEQITALEESSKRH